MKLAQLRITHLPGIQQGYGLDHLDPGLNIITGPNASGKSSLVRALRYLVDPQSAPEDGAITLQATFLADGDRLEVTRTGSQVVWRKNGESAEPPALPETDFLHCYWLSMADLLEEGRTERAILDQLRRELAGGFDLNAIRQSAPFSIGPQYGQSQERQLREREKHLRGIRQEYESLERQRETLPELEERIRAAEAASQEQVAVENALALVEARTQRSEAETLLSRFPESLERLHGDEAQRLQTLEGQLDQLRDEHREAEQSLSRARRAMDDTGLAEKSPSTEDMAACRENLEEAGQCAARLTDQQESLDKARAREQQAAHSLKSVGETQVDLSPGAVERAMQLAQRLRDRRQRVEALEAETGVEAPDESAFEAQRTMAEELRRWLRQLEPVRFRHLLVGGGIALVAALGALVGGILAGITMAAVPALIAALGGAWSLWQLKGMSRERQQAHQRALEQPVPPPDSWDPGAVSERLRALEDRIAREQLQLERSRESQLRQQELEGLRASLAELEREKAQLAGEIGFDPSVTGETIAWFVHVASELGQARAQRAEVEHRMARLQEQMETHLGRVCSVVNQYGAGVEADPDPAAVRSHFQALTARVEQLREAESEYSRASEDKTRLEKAIAQTRNALDELYQSAGLEPGERQALLDYCSQLDSYRQARERVREARVLEQDRQNRLETAPELLRLAQEGEDAALRRRLTEAREASDELEALRNQRSELKVQLDETGRNRDLEQARLARDRAYNALEDAWNQAMVAEAGQFLLAGVAEEHRAEHQPAVLADARWRLARFTHNRYDLSVGESGRIEVRDTVQGALQRPDRLSTGTRMQLFLAVRLAWTSVHEGLGESLPIFLDEALTTSDPERFEAIVHNLRDLAEQEGRQIIYLSSEPEDVARWSRVLGQPLHHIDLLASDGAGEAVDPTQYQVASPPAIAGPEGRSPEDYAALIQVPRIQPHNGAGAIHLFHLLRDRLTVLHELMEQWRARQLGELELLLDSNAASRVVADESLAQQLRARCRIARIWMELWNRGRGRRVDRNALEASGIITENFIDAVTEELDAVDGDAEALIQALKDRRVARFQQAKAEELADWFRENGYIVDEPPLSPEQREQQTLWRAGDLAEPQEIQALVSWLESGLRA